jgi:hypothetical protein
MNNFSMNKRTGLHNVKPLISGRRLMASLVNTLIFNRRQPRLTATKIEIQPSSYACLFLSLLVVF